MIGSILVPLDGSALAESILPCVRAFARLTSAEVTLFQAVEPLPTGEKGPLEALLARTEPVIEPTEHARAYLIHVAQELSHQGLVVHARVETGPAAETIVEAARGFDLIAMATHGRGGIGRWVYGSVAEKVLHGASAPVLLIRAREEAMADPCLPQRILVPLDGSELAEQVLPLAASIARQAEAEVTLTHSIAWARMAVVEPYGYGTGFSAATLLDEAEAGAKEYLSRVQRQLAADHVPVQTTISLERAPEAILDYAEERQISLIIMSTHGRGGLGRWVLGSTADRVLRGATVPVLLVRAGVPTPTLESEPEASAHA